MPRHLSAVKSKQSPARQTTILETPGLVDLHFHGAFGIDLMRAEGPELDELSAQLFRNGIAGFCPTTLSGPQDILMATVERIGGWIQSRKAAPSAAIPLGIHLEGPFISQRAAGAHPPTSLRAFSMEELKEYWEASQQTLKILTIAADEIPAHDLSTLVHWTRTRGIALSLGHTHASESEARRVFQAGVTHVTHAWNALRFHHRDPGVLGAALGNRNIFVELILDQIHVAPSLMNWTCQLHGADRICFVSDCAPAAGLAPKRESTFGPLSVRTADGAARLPDGSLAGGGLLLSKTFENWVNREVSRTRTLAGIVLKQAIPSVTSAPLRSLNLPIQTLAGRKIRWKLSEKTARLLVSARKSD